MPASKPKDVSTLKGFSLVHTPSSWNELNFRINQLTGSEAAIACLFAHMGFNLGLSGGGVGRETTTSKETT